MLTAVVLFEYFYRFFLVPLLLLALFSSRNMAPSLKEEGTSSEMVVDVDMDSGANTNHDSKGKAAAAVTDANNTSSDPNRPCILEALPTELVAQVIDNLARDDPDFARQLRLVCRLFNSLASPYGVQNTIAYLHKSDFNAIQFMSSKPHIAMGVRSFTYVPDMVVHPGTLEEFNWEYRDLRKADIAEAPSASARRKLLKKRKLTHAEVHSHWLKAKAYYIMQKSLIGDEDDIEFLQDVLPRFPNLEEIVMQSELTTLDAPNKPGKPRRRRTPFDDGLGEFSWRPLQPEGFRALNAMLEGLPAKNRINTLRAGAINWRFFEPTNVAALTRCMDIAPQLTRLGFQVETGWDEEGELFGVEAVQCRHMMQSGTLREMLRRAVNLEALYVDFEEVDADEAFPAHLHDFIGPTQVWRKLKILEIGGFECDRHELVALLRRHSASLTEVFLRSISLQKTSWIPFLEEMRAACPELLDAAISGPLIGENETTQAGEFWDTGPLDGGEADEMGNAIASYLTCREHHDHENPFEVFPYTETNPPLPPPPPPPAAGPAAAL
jgi:hypothetical protein